jgi:hypothetical protein
MPNRPKSLTFIAVVAILLGAITALSSSSSALMSRSTLLASPLPAPASADGAEPTMHAKMLAAQLEFQRRVAEINGRHRGFFLAVLPFALLASAAMIVGGAAALSLRRWARPLLMAALVTGFGVGVARAKPDFDLQLELANATSDMMSAMVDGMDAATAGSRSAQSVIASTAAVTKIATMAGVGMRMAFVVAQLGFLVVGAIYLARARTRELFAGQLPLATPAPAAAGERST